MRILIVSQYFWPENFRINDLAIGLKEKGNEVTILTGIPNYPEGKVFPGYNLFAKKEIYKGIKIYRVPLLPRGKGGKLNLILNYLSFFISASFLAPFYCRQKYDAIFGFVASPIIQVLPAIFLKKIRNSTLILWVLDLWPESLTATKAVRSPLIIKWVEKIVKFIYKQSDLILASSRGFIPSITAKGVGLEKIVFFPNWAEDIYEPVEPENAKLPLAVNNFPKGFKLMFAGNIGVAQDFETILAAFEILKNYKDIHLLILGNGRMYNWVHEQIIKRNLSGQVHLLGAYPMETMPNFFSFSDALLVTLNKDLIFSITIPGKLQSYLACGKPVIGALNGEGARLIRESNSGFVCPSGEPKELSEAILKIYHAGLREREQMGLNAREYYKNNFNRDKQVDNLINLIKHFLV